MAFIYKYILKDPTNRKNEDLRKYRNSIENTIRDVFKGSLKEVLVEEDYFEFKLYLKASDQILKEMGKELVKRDNSLDVLKRVTRSGGKLFIRSDSDYYAYLEKYSEGTKEFVLNFDVVKKFDVANSTSYSDLQIDKREVLRKIDTYKISLYFNIDKISRKLRSMLQKLKEDNWYLIKGRLSNSEQDSEMFLDFTAFHRSDNNDNRLISGFKVSSIYDIENNTKKDINQFFSIDGIDYRMTSNPLPEVNKIKVVIYNVGQGLCTAICDENEKPYIYFDFGCGHGRNKCTYPGGMSYDPTHHPKIILSHWDTDHYILINECADALDSEWITSNNAKGPYASKIYAELSKRNNLVVVSSDQDLTWGRIIVGNGNNNHKHNDGLSLLLESKNKDSNNNIIIKKCLMTGDNRYNVLPGYALQNLDVLLASHHGGTYGNATNMPISKNDGLVIYSYGKDDKFLPYFNSHKHPSRVQDYIKAGWTNEVHTPDGNYIFDL